MLWGSGSELLYQLSEVRVKRVDEMGVCVSIPSSARLGLTRVERGVCYRCVPFCNMCSWPSYEWGMCGTGQSSFALVDKPFLSLLIAQILEVSRHAALSQNRVDAMHICVV